MPNGQSTAKDGTKATVTPLKVTPVGGPESKPRKERKSVSVGVFENILAAPHGMIWKPLRDEDANDREFESTAEADKWLKGNAKEGDNDKVFLIAPLRKVTLKATRQLKITMER